MNFKERAQQLVSQMNIDEKISQMKFDAPAIERLGIPAYNWWNECLHGVGRAGTATVFPQAIGLAASFNKPLMNKVATAISDEARAKNNEYKKFGDTQIYQGLTYWSPNINIFRDPRWGRGHETYGEDPYLTAEMGTAFVKGLQDGSDTYRKLDATLKHYAVHSGPEGERHTFNACVTDEDLYETYLWAFDYCIKHASPSAVMGAYNRINGEPCCGSETYLKGALYEHMGFNGYVVSDCGAICDFDQNHHITKTPAHSAALAVNNGCQLNCGTAYQYVKAAVDADLISEETIHEAVVRLYEARFRLGMFDECEFDNIPYDVIDCERHKSLNLAAALESIVLLKNDGILPLKKTASIAVIGPNAHDTSVLFANYSGTASQSVTPLDGIFEQCEGKVLYARGCHIYDDKFYYWQEQPLREAVIAAQKSDIVLFIGGLNPSMEGEEGDAYNGAASGDKADIQLPASQQKLLSAVCAAGKPVVFVNISGSCVNLAPAAQKCGAVLQVFYPGALGGRALASLLYGSECPSGRLPVTFYENDEDLPDFKSYSMKERTYKYFTGTPAFPFAHGLSYTSFTEKIVSAGENAVIAEIKNTGSRDAKRAVCVFAYQRGSNVNCRLAGFEKIVIEKGVTKQIRIELCPEVMKLFSKSIPVEFATEPVKTLTSEN